MEKEVKQVAGINYGTSKTGNDFTILHLIGNPPEYLSATFKGKFCENVYVRGTIPAKIGDSITLNYQPGFQGKAVVSGVNILEGVAK